MKPLEQYDKVFIFSESLSQARHFKLYTKIKINIEYLRSESQFCGITNFCVLDYGSRSYNEVASYPYYELLHLIKEAGGDIMDVPDDLDKWINFISEPKKRRIVM